MTFLEKFLQDHPGKGEDWAMCGCPCDFGYEPEIDCCVGVHTSCWKCWHREMPETENIEKENEDMAVKQDYKPTKEELLAEINSLNKQLSNLNKYKKYEDCANELKAALDAMMDAGFTREEAMSIILASAKN